MKSPSATPPAIHALLKRAGLSEKEAGVYLTVLAFKSARASAIAKEAGQSRSNTYLLLESLVEKGLVSEVEQGKVLHFVAESPERLIRYAKDKEQSFRETSLLLEQAMPAFHSMEGPLQEEPRVTKFHGMEGMKQIYSDLLSREFCGIFNPAYSHDFLGENIVTSVFGTQANLKGRDLLVESPQITTYLKQVKPSSDYQVRILPKEIAPKSDFIIADNTIALLAYDRYITTVRIENKNIADSFRMWFEALWQLSTQRKSS
jgi:predicted transcriptional regulator